MTLTSELEKRPHLAFPLVVEGTVDVNRVWNLEHPTAFKLFFGVLVGHPHLDWLKLLEVDLLELPKGVRKQWAILVATDPHARNKEKARGEWMLNELYARYQQSTVLWIGVGLQPIPVNWQKPDVLAAKALRDHYASVRNLV